MHVLRKLSALAVAIGFSVLGTAGSANGASHRAASLPVVHAVLFAKGPAGATNPDDITMLGDLVYVTFQNNAQADGSPEGATSTIVAFDHSGNVVTTYTLPGRCDGLTADPVTGRVLATVNEDLDSSFYVITPGNPTPTHYTYSPDPAETGSDGTNGGTDSIGVAPDGTIYVAHSNPDLTQPAPDNTAAVYRVTLKGGVANLTRFFGVNDRAWVIDPVAPTSTPQPMGLTDPDSNRFVPDGGGGTLIQVSQADSKLIFARDPWLGHPLLRQLLLTNATAPKNGPATPQLDDVVDVQGSGTLWVVDQKGDAIYTVALNNINAPLLFAAQPAPSSGDLPNDPALAVVNTETGVVTHVDSTFVSPKGLMWVPGQSCGPTAAGATKKSVTAKVC